LQRAQSPSRECIESVSKEQTAGIILVNRRRGVKPDFVLIVETERHKPSIQRPGAAVYSAGE
jgi:hypothetical protein